jgi:hypothetical protein
MKHADADGVDRVRREVLNTLAEVLSTLILSAEHTDRVQDDEVEAQMKHADADGD